MRQEKSTIDGREAMNEERRSGERLLVTVLRVVAGVAALAASGVLIRAAAMRLVRGLATLFGGAVALVTGVFLLGGAAWTLVRRWRRRRAQRASD